MKFYLEKFQLVKMSFRGRFGHREEEKNCVDKIKFYLELTALLSLAVLYIFCLYVYVCVSVFERPSYFYVLFFFSRRFSRLKSVDFLLLSFYFSLIFVCCCFYVSNKRKEKRKALSESKI